MAERENHSNVASSAFVVVLDLFFLVCRHTSCTGVAFKLQICNTCSSVLFNGYACVMMISSSYFSSRTAVDHAFAACNWASAVAFVKDGMIGRQHMGAIVKVPVRNSQHMICNYESSTGDAEHACVA